jgi:DNA-3-methyladenine glycosylase II
MTAHRTVWNRFIEIIGDVTPSNLSHLSIDDIKSCGTSRKKATYIKGIADSFADGTINVALMKEMSDEDLCAYLTKLKGIGKWTAEMLMIFSLERKNIFSFSDVSILRGLRMLYRHKEISLERFEKYRKRFSPYCTIASFYLWEIAGGALPEYKDPVQNTKKKKKG